MPPCGSQEGDVYSFGIILQEIVVRGEPYDTEQVVMDIKGTSTAYGNELSGMSTIFDLNHHHHQTAHVVGGGVRVGQSYVLLKVYGVRRDVWRGYVSQCYLITL